MRICLSFTISDNARRLIDSPHKTKDGLATRQTVKDWVRGRLERMESVAEWFVPPTITDTEIVEAKEAYIYLRAIGKTEEQCWQWIFRQRALKECVKHKVTEHHLREISDQRPRTWE